MRASYPIPYSVMSRHRGRTHPRPHTHHDHHHHLTHAPAGTAPHTPNACGVAAPPLPSGAASAGGAAAPPPRPGPWQRGRWKPAAAPRPAAGTRGAGALLVPAWPLIGRAEGSTAGPCSHGVWGGWRSVAPGPAEIQQVRTQAEVGDADACRRVSLCRTPLLWLAER